jgi:DNA polymerase III sliding clamp (beta) subunit (PCNA family)
LTLTVKTAALRDAIKLLSGIVSRVNIAPVLGCARLLATGSTLEVHATNLDNYAVKSLECSGEPIDCCVDIRRLALFLSVAGSETQVSVGDRAVQFSSWKARSSIPSVPPDEWPDFRGDIPTEWVSIDGTVFADRGRAAARASDKGAGEPFKRAVYVSRQGSAIRFQSTIGHCGARQDLNCTGAFDPACLDPSFFGLVPEGSCEFSSQDGKAWVRSDGWLAVSKVIDAQFPDMEGALKSFSVPNTTGTADKASLLAAIVAAEGVNIDVFRPCHIVINDSGGWVYALSESGGYIDTPFDGQGVVSAVANTKYLRAMIESLDAETIDIQVHESRMVKFMPYQANDSLAWVMAMRHGDALLRPTNGPEA